ncbi:protein tyrosine/serine phosphatase [Rhodococcus sp. LBL1]|nr:protein tyrosine/serine phosphatase [Rhodococcus sp. LBL1]MDH6685399.1 protein tyrosine/serine phosphatase [Rhodococcus sp. LBL2]
MRPVEGRRHDGCRERSSGLVVVAGDFNHNNSDAETPARQQLPQSRLTWARYTQVNIIGDTASGAVTASVDLSTPENAAAVLTDANRKFVTDPAMRAQFGVLLTDIATTDGPQIFHCTAGKDRAGWTSAVLLKIAGVDDATVMSNYLLTNEYSKDSIEATTAQVAAAKGEQAGAAMKVLMGVSPEFLQAGLDEIGTNFGTFDNYLTTGLGLSADTISALKTKLTV